MLDPSPGHSPDLEWLLQSGEASQATIIEYLLRETYEPILKLSFALLGDLEAAQQSAFDAIAEAVLRARLYTGETSVLDWLDELTIRTLQLGKREKENTGQYPPSILADFTADTSPAIPVTGSDAWSAVENLAALYRLPFVLKIIRGFSSQDIARILNESVEDIETRLEVARRFVMSGPSLADLSRGEDLEDRLIEGFQHRWNAAANPLPRHDELGEQVQRRIGQKTSRRFQARLLGQGLLAVLAVVFIVALTRFQSQGLSEAVPISTSIHTVVVTQVVPVTRTPDPTPTPGPTPVPLKEDMDVMQVRRRIIDSTHLWQTLWADALVIHYGPAGYLGPPQVYRNQVWIRQPDHALVLGGPAEAAPEYLRLIDRGYAYEADLATGITFEKELTPASLTNLAMPFIHRPWETTAPENTRLYGYYLYDLLQPADAWWPLGVLNVIGMDTVAGREAVIVEWLTHQGTISAQMWVDAQTGMLLRLWLLDHDHPGVVEMEIRITAIVLDADIPATFFEKTNAWFDRPTWGYLWQPVSDEIIPPEPVYPPPPGRSLVSLNPPPTKLDFYDSDLTFQWLSQSDDPLQPGDQVDLISDGYWLGRVEMGNPWDISCERSPSGRYLAFSRGYESALSLSSGLSWIDLDQADSVHNPFPNGFTGGDFAFSPDSKTLAFWGCGGNGLNCGLYLHNLGTRENIRVISLSAAAYFTWNPDGKQLAMVGRVSDDPIRGDWEFMVLQVESGALEYRAEVDLLSLQVPGDAPIHDWDVRFPPREAGLEGCLE